jgi:hypothetical protein
MAVINTAEIIKITSAEKNEFLISFNLLLPNFRSSPASSTIIISPTIPNASTNFGGKTISTAKPVSKIP